MFTKVVNLYTNERDQTIERDKEIDREGKILLQFGFESWSLGNSYAEPQCPRPKTVEGDPHGDKRKLGRPWSF